MSFHKTREIKSLLTLITTAAMMQWARAFTSEAEAPNRDRPNPQKHVVTAPQLIKPSEIGMGVTGPQRKPL